MAMCEIKFDEGERALIQDHADVAGMSFPEFVKMAALEKAEDMADIKAYDEALDGDGGTRYPMEEVVRMAVEAECGRHASSVSALKVSLGWGSACSRAPLFCGFRLSV